MSIVVRKGQLGALELNDASLLRSQALIDGQWCAASSGETFAVANPASGEQIATVACCGADDATRAVAAASW